MEGNMMNIKFSHVTVGVFAKVLETDRNDDYKHGDLRTSITYVRISKKELMRIFEGKLRTQQGAGEKYTTRSFILRHFRKITKSDYWLHHMSVRPSVCPFARDNSSTTGRIFIIFDF
jgi:hypothetical protein